MCRGFYLDGVLWGAVMFGQVGDVSCSFVVVGGVGVVVVVIGAVVVGRLVFVGRRGGGGFVLVVASGLVQCG